jgi:hypothetical protein
MIGALSLACLAGCAGNKSQIVKATNGSTLEVAPIFASADMNGNRYADTKLREVTPTASGVGMGLAVIGAVLGGGVSTNSFDKNAYKGSSIDALPEPTASYLAPKAEVKIRDWLGKQAASHQYEYPLYLAASNWSLVYSDMSSENSNYDLSYHVQFYKRPEGGNVFSAFIVADCSPTVKTAPIAEWRANNYQKVTLETQKMMDACLLELDNQLPRLLKVGS